MAVNGNHINGTTEEKLITLTKDASTEVAKREDIMGTERYFPSFFSLPDVGGVNDSRFENLKGSMLPMCTWIFAAEIVNSEYARDVRERHKIIVRDRRRLYLQVIFIYSSDQTGLFDFREIINGRTIFLMCPYKTKFLDQTLGIVVKNLRTVKVIKNSLRALMALSWDRSLGKRCESCKKPNPKFSCQYCNATFYCSENCQRIDQRAFHVLRCNAIKEFDKLYDITFEIYVNNLGFVPSDPS